MPIKDVSVDVVTALETKECSRRVFADVISDMLAFSTLVTTVGAAKGTIVPVIVGTIEPGAMLISVLLLKPGSSVYGR